MTSTTPMSPVRCTLLAWVIPFVTTSNNEKLNCGANVIILLASTVLINKQKGRVGINWRFDVHYTKGCFVMMGVSRISCSVVKCLLFGTLKVSCPTESCGSSSPLLAAIPQGTPLATSTTTGLSLLCLFPKSNILPCEEGHCGQLNTHCDAQAWLPELPQQMICHGK